jgi:hypothetical protein
MPTNTASTVFGLEGVTDKNRICDPGKAVHGETYAPTPCKSHCRNVLPHRVKLGLRGNHTRFVPCARGRAYIWDAQAHLPCRRG